MRTWQGQVVIVVIVEKGHKDMNVKLRRKVLEICQEGLWPRDVCSSVALPCGLSHSVGAA